MADCSLGSLSDYPQKTGTLQEEEPRRLLGRLGKCERTQVAFADEWDHERGLCPHPEQDWEAVGLVTQQGELGVCAFAGQVSAQPIVSGFRS